MARMPGPPSGSGRSRYPKHRQAGRAGAGHAAPSLGWQARIVLDPVAGRRAEAGFGGSNGSVVGLSELMYSLIWWSVMWRPGNV